ncbi:MAG TPA: hypothetical protein IAA30_09180 [Candidatus Treponema faecavium]|nr:hypothetical protein [Candidatus Treponema faecavium]
MELAQVVAVVKAVLSDWRVICITAAVLLYLNFIMYVIRYRKRPARILPRKRAAVSAAAAQKAPADEPSEEDGA